MSQSEHETVVVAQFGSRAEAYVASSVHAQGDDLREIVELVRGHAGARVLDLGCGGGHVAFSVAPHVAEVIAYDLSTAMLDAVTREAAARGLATIATACGPAERLPFPDATFDFVMTRFSAHHWYDVRAGIVEARRVLKASGTAVFIDVIAPAHVVHDTFLQSIELLRDPSHVRDYSAAEWLQFLEEAGFAVARTTHRRLPLDFASWIARMQTPPVRAAAIRSLHEAASPGIAAAFEIAGDGSFVVDTLAVEASPMAGA